MSKIKYISFSKKDAVFDSERIVGELLDVCEQIDLGEGGTMCTIQAVQGELVHCKDCRFWGTALDGYCDAIDDPYMLETDADDFCSWGERK